MVFLGFRDKGGMAEEWLPRTIKVYEILGVIVDAYEGGKISKSSLERLFNGLEELGINVKATGTYVAVQLLKTINPSDNLPFLVMLRRLPIIRVSLEFLKAAYEAYDLLIRNRFEKKPDEIIREISRNNRGYAFQLLASEFMRRCVDGPWSSSIWYLKLLDGKCVDIDIYASVAIDSGIQHYICEVTLDHTKALRILDGKLKGDELLRYIMMQEPKKRHVIAERVLIFEGVDKKVAQVLGEAAKKRNVKYITIRDMYLQSKDKCPLINDAIKAYAKWFNIELN